MFVFDSLNALKASTEIVEGVLYKAPDRDGALRTWLVKSGNLSRDTFNYLERCTSLSSTFVVNKSGYFSNFSSSHRSLTPVEDDGLLYYDANNENLYIFVDGNWLNIPASS